MLRYHDPVTINKLHVDNAGVSGGTFVNNYTVLSLALGFGMLHALDADHIMAVSGLAVRRPGYRSSLYFCLRWAMGHGFSLLIIGGSVLLFGLAIPVSLSAVAEIVAGVVLIAIGLWIITDITINRVRASHRDLEGPENESRNTGHSGSVLPVTVSENKCCCKSGRGATLVGVVHGTAGTAPLLAILPLSSVASPMQGISYLVLFGCGVLLSMIFFGGLLGVTFGWFARRSHSAMQFTRVTVAFCSVGAGICLLQTSLTDSII